MHALILAAALVAAPQNTGQTTRDIVVGVCLPFVASGSRIGNPGVKTIEEFSRTNSVSRKKTPA